jgi:autotransporter translocation and assembly factor TamB
VSEGLLSITSAAIQLGQTPISVAGSVNLNATPIDLNLDLTAGDVAIAEIARLASAFGVAFAPGADVSGRIRGNVRVRGAAEAPALTGTITGSDLRISGTGIPLPVDVKALELALSPSEIRSNEFTATSGMTAVNARFGVKQYMSNSPSIDAALRAPNASLPEIRAIAKAFGVTGLDQINGQGSLNLDLRASSATTTLDSSAVLRALQGTINLDFSPLRMEGFDIAREMGVIGGFVSNAAARNFTEVIRLTGRILVQNGVARSEDLQAQMAIGKLTGGGTANLVTEELNLKLSAVLSKASSDRVGSTGIAGYMSTALSNTQGELIIPLLVTGTFKQPKFAPDVQAFAEMQRRRLLPSFENPRAAVSGILGALTAPRQEQQQQAPQNNAGPQQQQQRPQDAVKGVLEGIFGRQKAPADGQQQNK